MFEQVIGQREVQHHLMQMVSEGRLPHAIMLCGPQGAGKKALAIAFAKVLLSQPTSNSSQSSMFDPEPPTVSANTQAMLDKLEHPDLHFTYPTIKLP